jgi:hypothetical protein
MRRQEHRRAGARAAVAAFVVAGATAVLTTPATAAASTASAAPPAVATPPAPPPVVAQDASAGAIAKPTEGRVDPALRPVTTESARSAPSPADVEVLHEAGAEAAIRAAVAAGGGSVTGEVPGAIVQARVPVAALDTVGAVAGVVEVRPPVDINVIPDQVAEAGSVTAQSVGKTLASQWHAAGITGAGVRVGIIDVFDIAAWDVAAASGDLPPRASVPQFCRAAGSPCSVFDGGSRHGNAVAEIVRDMAPGAGLVLVYVQTTSDLRAAIDWMANANVRIVNRSQGAPFDGPGNGTGPLADTAAYAVSRGITFFNSAGNAGNGGYWRGPWRDADGDRLLDWAPGDDFLGISVNPCAIALGFRWNDWGPAAGRTDYDVYIDIDNNGVINGADRGWEDLQQLGAPPIEMAGGLVGNCTGPQTVQVAVRLFDPGAGTAGDVLELMVNGAALERWSKPFSGTQPISDSANPGVVSVGAIDPWNGTTIAPYSSNGPTNDFRTKPDLAAPACVSTVSLGASCFNGTSSASPVAAGAGALVRQAGLAADAASVRAFLASTAAERGPVGIDNVFGAGELRLPPLPPAGFAKGRFAALTPFRLLDTRTGQGEPGGRVAPGGVLKAAVLGRGGVPAAGVSAVVVNVTAVGTGGAGYLQVYPHAWATLGGASNLNSPGPSETVAGLAVVPVGHDGKIAVLDQPGSHIVIDVFGYFAQANTSRGGRLDALTPARIYDTRAGGGKARAGQVVPVTVAGRGGVPASGASAVVLNLTATLTEAGGFVQVLPGQSGTVRGWSNLNLVRPWQTAANLVIVPLDASGRVRLYTNLTTHLIVDVMGYFTGDGAPESASGLFTPIRPTRVRDTRTGSPVPPGGRLVVAPLAHPMLAGTNADAVFLTVTAVAALGPGFVQVYPTGAPVEGRSSNLNVTAKNQTRPNAAVTTLGAGKQFTIYTQGGAHLLADVAGWFSS